MAFLIFSLTTAQLQFHIYKTLCPGGQKIYYDYHFCDTFFFFYLLCIPLEQPQTKLRLFHGYFDKINKVGEGSKIKKAVVAETIITIDYLAT